MKSIATKLTASFLLVIVGISLVFSVAGVRFIGSTIVSEAQTTVRTHLNSAREIYLGYQLHVSNAVRFTADRTFLRAGLPPRDLSTAVPLLRSTKETEGLDLLTVTDAAGRVVLRTNNPKATGDDESESDLVRAVLKKKELVAATTIVPGAELAKESAQLSERAYFRFIPTTRARARTDTEESSGMMLMAAAPIFDYENRFLGVVYGGVLLNRNFEIVDKIKQTVFQDVKYNNVDIGTATIFQDDVRISTNVRNADGSRAVGTRIAADVYTQVVDKGQSWIDRAFVVNNWYITAYEPIRDIRQNIVGILYVGILEQKYTDMEARTTLLFLGITVLAALASMTLAYLISQRIVGPLRQLVVASKEVARGDLSTEVRVATNDELRELAEAFNSMASALRKRDAQLKESARLRIMESERLAIIGQLAAGVAHELNNPLQGVVSYSHLLLERLRPGDPTREAVQRIATQAGRCTNIIRGLLDFARQRKPQKRMANINTIVNECTALLENQSLFHNIRVHRRLQPDLPTSVIDPSEMQQVFTNMLINAAEAMQGEGEITISTRVHPIDGFIEAEVSDTGCGISEEEMGRIFDPFFTTKVVGHGTGLGLAISYGIVKEHGGTISVESQVGHGATFTVRLPLAAAEVGVASD